MTLSQEPKYVSRKAQPVVISYQVSSVVWWPGAAHPQEAVKARARPAEEPGAEPQELRLTYIHPQERKVGCPDRM